MTHQTFEHHFHTVVVGGGQAALAIGYFAKGAQGTRRPGSSLAWELKRCAGRLLKLSESLKNTE